MKTDTLGLKWAAFLDGVFGARLLVRDTSGSMQFKLLLLTTFRDLLASQFDLYAGVAYTQ